MHSIRSLTAALLSFGASLCLAAPVMGEETCSTYSVASRTTNWESSISIQRFDPALGTLQSISVEVTGKVEGVARVESLDTATSVVLLSFQGEVRVMRPDQSSIFMVAPVAHFLDAFSAFDGKRDFAGTSGCEHSGILALKQGSVSLFLDANDLALFTGPAGNPGRIDLLTAAHGTSLLSGSGNIESQFVQRASATVRLCYQFIPFAPPTIRCPGSQVASVGVPLTFDVRAFLPNPKAPAALTASGMPNGAKFDVLPDETAQMLSRRFRWTPTTADVGSTTVTFTANDSLMHTVTCAVTIATAECHMLFASAVGSSSAIVFGRLYDTQLAGVRRFFPVSMDNHPSVRASVLPSVFVVQIVRYNPLAFTTEPTRSSQPMTVTRDATGHMQSSYSGTDHGICIRLHEFFVNGVRYVRFPFEVSGM